MSLVILALKFRPEHAILAGMKHIIIPVAIAAILAGPLSAQDSKAPDIEKAPDSGTSLIEDGVRMFFEGLLKEAEPAMRDMRDLAEKLGPQLRSFAEEMGPALADILKDIDDLSVYEAPEKLPNGDIIIRRKPPQDAPKLRKPPVSPEPDHSGEIEI